MQTVCQTQDTMRGNLINFHIHILFCIKGLKKRPYCMWLCIPEGKPIWQVKILQREIHSQNNDQNKTIQTSVKTSHYESHWQKTLIGCILKLFKRSLNLAVCQVFTSLQDSVKPLPFNSVHKNNPSIMSLMFNIIYSCH